MIHYVINNVCILCHKKKSSPEEQADAVKVRRGTSGDVEEERVLPGRWANCLGQENPQYHP